MKKGFLIFDMLETVVIVLAIFVIIYSFIASPHLIVGMSMENNFHDGEFLFTNKFTYRFQPPQRGDVVIFKYNALYDYIKRVIAVPGDKVYLHGGYVYVNGKRLVESTYVASNNLTYGIHFLDKEDQTITVPADKYFVLGDNRGASSDSRDWGFVDKTAIEGKAWVVYWPVKDFRFVPSVHYSEEGSDLVGRYN